MAGRASQQRWLARVAIEDPEAAAYLADQPTPVSVVAPEPWVIWIWRAWHRLHLDRPQVAGGMGPPIPQRIPWTTVQAWCDRYEIDDDFDRALMDECFIVMDTEYLNHWSAEEKQRQELLKTKSKS